MFLLSFLSNSSYITFRIWPKHSHWGGGVPEKCPEEPHEDREGWGQFVSQSVTSSNRWDTWMMNDSRLLTHYCRLFKQIWEESFSSKMMGVLWSGGCDGLNIPVTYCVQIVHCCHVSCHQAVTMSCRCHETAHCNVTLFCLVLPLCAVFVTQLKCWVHHSRLSNSMLIRPGAGSTATTLSGSYQNSEMTMTFSPKLFQ